MAARTAWLAIVLAASSCAGDDKFTCERDDECHGQDGGMCEPIGFCSFPDIACKSGRRYGEHSGNLSRACVSPTVGIGTTGTTGAASSSGSSSSSSTGLGLTSAVDSTGAGSTSTSTGADPGTSSSSTGDGIVDPYGPCTSTCEHPSAICLIDADAQSICAPLCTTAAVPSDECPVPLDARGFEVGCFELLRGGTRCFISCDAMGACPTAMTCAGGVCVWPPS